MDVTQITQPDLYIFNIRVMEPVTSLTDVIVGVICFYAFWKMKKANLLGRKFSYLKWYFMLMGIATCIGGLIGHGFLYLFNDHWRLVGWITSMIAVMLIERSSIEHASKLMHPTLGKVFLFINIVELLTLMILTIYNLHFKFVELHTVYGFIVVVFSFHLFTYIKTKDKGSLQMIYTVLTLLLAMYAFNKPVVLHEWFNHRDLAHVVMAVATFMLLKATLKLEQDTSKKIIVGRGNHH